MISLKHLLMLMGSVSLLMTIAVVVVKVNHPGHISLAEVRAIDRLCHRFADDMLEEIYQRNDQESGAQTASNTEEDSRADSRSAVSPKVQAERLEELHACMVSCREYLITSRSKTLSETDRAQLEVPACFGAKLTKLVEDARSAQSRQTPSSSQAD